MKKVLLICLGLLTVATSAFAAKNDINFGLEYGSGKAKFDNESNGIKFESISAEGIGLYVDASTDFTEHFGIFTDASFSFPSKTTLDYIYKGSKYSISDKDIYSIPFVMSCMFGLQGVITPTEKFKIRLGAGFDYSLFYQSLEYSGLKSVEVDYAFGIGLKGCCVYMFTERFGMNFGLASDILFGGIYSTTTTYRGNKTTDSGTYSRNMYFIRPEVGFTFKLGRDE